MLVKFYLFSITKKKINILGGVYIVKGFPGGTVLKNPPANGEDARDTGLIPGLGRSPGVGNGNPLQYSCLKNSMDKEAWWATVQGSQRVGRD